MSGLIDPAMPFSSGVLLANMGVEDEWGPEIPKNRLLNEGRPLNFILPDPTQMRYIDPPWLFITRELWNLPKAEFCQAFFLLRRKWKSIFFP